MPTSYGAGQSSGKAVWASALNTSSGSEIREPACSAATPNSGIWDVGSVVWAIFSGTLRWASVVIRFVGNQLK